MLQLLNSTGGYFALLFLGTFLATLFFLPRIRENSLRFGLYDEPNHRSSHTKIVPSLGGIAFYIIFILAIFVSNSFDVTSVGVVLVASMTVIFFTGLKDDLHNLSPRMKLLGQLIAVLILVSYSEFRIASFHGFLGIYDLPLIVSYLLTIVLFIALINAYNLIDGIDGMASIVGIVIATSFAFLFFKLAMYFFLAISVAVVGTLLAFLRFNFSPSKKIFMGDTGSLLIGLVLGALGLRLLSLGASAFDVLAIKRGDLPILLVGILFIPFFDILRVTFIRWKNGKSISSPDRNHIHHLLIDAGLSHRRASVFCGLANIGIVLTMFYSIREFGIVFSMVVLSLLIFSLVLMFFAINRTYAALRQKVMLRKFLYNCSQIFVGKKEKRNEVQTHRIAFNQKLKRIRVLFF